MDKLGDWEQKSLINELTQGKELAKQLQIHLNVASSSTHEAPEVLVEKILNSYDKALSVLKWTGGGSVAATEAQLIGSVAMRTSESPRGSLSGSPHSEDSDRDFKDAENRSGSRKRKSMPMWTRQVQVCPGSGLEGPLDDGHNWRKYGQKDILGAKYPRGYYRCTYRNVQGCMATKQVQRSDEDPTIFEITYRGTHTCNTNGSSSQQPQPPPLENPEPNTPQAEHHHQPPQQQNQPNPQEALINFQTGLTVITHDLDDPKQSLFPSFYGFPSALPNMPSMVADNSNNLMGPTFSGAHYFPQMTNNNIINSFGGIDDTNNYQNFQTSQSDLSEIVSAAAATSTTNSPTFGLEFPFLPMDFDSTNFNFDNPDFFP